jgi:uncharacterized protein YqgC (DUF456 family)
MTLTAAFIVVCASVIGVLLTALTLPGIWFTLAVAAGLQLWRADLFSWWLLLAVFILALVSEVLDLFASAIGARRAGGTRRASIGSLIGAFVGAIAGTPLIPIPIVGSILGGAIGAGLGALLLERHGGTKTWAQSARIGGGAAIGRFTASMLKIALAAAIGAVLSVVALVNGALAL